MLTKLEIDKARHGAFAEAGVMVAVRLSTGMLIEEERKRIDSNATMEWAVAVMNTDTIGKIKIFQATLEEAMTLFASAFEEGLMLFATAFDVHHDPRTTTATSTM